ncbi:MAG: type II toxin-antitoxin system prevent-host-death family antitoxin [Azonexus sp.]|nr:type II toxin-antitoxin system prevent-host-death family antitoxin [Azonexus sp.]
MTARDAKNHFGEFLDSARREPVVVTKNDRPVGIMISLEDAKDTRLAPDCMAEAPACRDLSHTPACSTSVASRVRFAGRCPPLTRRSVSVGKQDHADHRSS